MKLSVALKKFSFVKKLDLPPEVIPKLANHLALTLKGSDEKFITPLAQRNDHFMLLVEWDIIYEAHLQLLNGPLIALERSNRSKFGPRSISEPWSARIASLKQSFIQLEDFIPHFSFKMGDRNFIPISLSEAVAKVRLNSSAGLPFLNKKSKSLELLLSDFENLLDREDPCMVYTRTAEKKKTRNVWGYPFALTLFELQFYTPILDKFKTMAYRAALVSPDEVDRRITGLIKQAIAQSKLIYSVDFKAFDASVRFQYIIKAFEVIKSYFDPRYDEFLDYICERMYSIPIVTPSGIYRGKHGVPSGATFTNEVDSIVQLGIALTCPFIREDECQAQGDDGMYILKKDDIPQFEEAFTSAGLKLEKSKSNIASDHGVFCQKLYHIDFMDENGDIKGIYPIYRALNRLLFQERYVDFGKLGLNGKVYFGIRTLTILENCKYHPLFEEFVRFIVLKEQRTLDVSYSNLVKYIKLLNLSRSSTLSLNNQYGNHIAGIREFASYKLAIKIAEEEGFLDSELECHEEEYETHVLD